MKHTVIKISGLKNGSHNFHFDLNSSFLAEFSTAIFDRPNVAVDVRLSLSELMIKTQVTVKGTVELICDRSDEVFDFKIDELVEHYFNFGEEEKELTDELEVINKERVEIDLDQLVYDTLALAVPVKKLHPRFIGEEDDLDSESEGKLIYTSDSQAQIENTEADPRWSKLKELSSLQ